MTMRVVLGRGVRMRMTAKWKVMDSTTTTTTTTRMKRTRRTTTRTERRGSAAALGAAALAAAAGGVVGGRGRGWARRRRRTPRPLMADAPRQTTMATGPAAAARSRSSAPVGGGRQRVGAPTWTSLKKRRRMTIKTCRTDPTTGHRHQSLHDVLCCYGVACCPLRIVMKSTTSRRGRGTVGAGVQARATSSFVESERMSRTSQPSAAPTTLALPEATTTSAEVDST
mmetsp:Transcript_23323/g.75115  ORF Transcript_23323/g.75115 Transcript_23323/m.75115 type:complete len:226 (-) Transcript_23323:325-1002(-)